jgi:pSer/pThr/pTyr-binding forkhead associated (FHA) protein
MEAKLNVVSGPFAGQTIQAPRGKLLIGRAEDCDLRPDSGFVSNYHCVLLLDDFTLRIRDLGSKNGTLVNGRRIGTGVTILVHDDMVSIGEMNILVDLSPPTSDAQTRTAVLPSGLQTTGIFEGDTVQSPVPEISPPAPSPTVSETQVPEALPPSAEKKS